LCRRLGDRWEAIADDLGSAKVPARH